MDYQEIIAKFKPELEKAILYLKREMVQVRTSRPSLSLVEGMQVECFGKKLPLKSLGQITLSDKNQVLVYPWDSSYLEPIEKALSQNQWGVSVRVEKDFIKVSFPILSEELRKNLIRLLSQKKEEVKKSIRRLRDAAWKEIQEGFSSGEITEDDKYRGKDKLQELIDEYNKKIDDMVEEKKKEVME